MSFKDIAVPDSAIVWHEPVRFRMRWKGGISGRDQFFAESFDPVLYNERMVAPDLWESTIPANGKLEGHAGFDCVKLLQNEKELFVCQARDRHAHILVDNFFCDDERDHRFREERMLGKIDGFTLLSNLRDLTVEVRTHTRHTRGKVKNRKCSHPIADAISNVRADYVVNWIVALQEGNARRTHR